MTCGFLQKDNVMIAVLYSASFSGVEVFRPSIFVNSFSKYVFCIVGNCTIFVRSKRVAKSFFLDVGENSVVTFFHLYCSDLADQRSVTQAEGEAYAKRHNMSFVETSAQKFENVDKVFDLLSKDVYENIKTGNVIPNAEVRMHAVHCTVYIHVVTPTSLLQLKHHPLIWSDMKRNSNVGFHFSECSLKHDQNV